MSELFNIEEVYMRAISLLKNNFKIDAFESLGIDPEVVFGFSRLIDNHKTPDGLALGVLIGFLAATQMNEISSFNAELSNLEEKEENP